ncbi:lytic transglycosylase domain-containing protein [candidate division WOR-3 bacterium]|nr:lytic transglycosylase domain-containing protein [candidate division WOR-3 bacterium]
MKKIAIIVFSVFLVNCATCLLFAGTDEIGEAFRRGDVLLARDLLSYENEFERSSSEYCVWAACVYLSMNAYDSSLFWAKKISDKSILAVEISGPLFRYDNTFRGQYADFAEAVEAFERRDYKIAVDRFIRISASGGVPICIEDYADYFIFCSYLMTGDTASALSTGEKFIEEHSTLLNPYVSGDLAQIYLSRGDIYEAVRHFRHSSLDDGEKFRAGKIFLSLGDTVSAIHYLTELLPSANEFSDSAWSLLISLGETDTLARARSLESSRKYEQLVSLLEPYVLSNWSDSEASLILGRALRRLSRHSDAVLYLENAAKSSLRRTALYNLGLCFRSLGKKSEEEAVWSSFVSEFQTGDLYDDALVYLAELKIGKGDRTEAIRLLKTVFESPHSNDMIQKAADIMFKLLDTRETAEFGEYVSGLRITERNVSLVYTTALKMSPDKAAEIFRKIGTSLPNSDYARRSERRLTEMEINVIPLSIDFAKTVEEALSDYQMRENAAKACERAKFLYAFGLRTWARKELETVASANPLEKFLMAKTAAAGLDRYKSIVYASSVRSQIGEPCPSELFFMIYPQAYRLAIENAAERFSLDIYWLQGLVRTESLFDESVISWAGAVGLAQLMPATANQVASTLGIRSYSLTDPDDNLTFGAKYLSDQLSNFKKIEIALAAYNAGPGNARKWICAGGGEEEYISNIGFAETRAYVPKVLTSAWIYRKIDGRVF